MGIDVVEEVTRGKSNAQKFLMFRKLNGQMHQSRRSRAEFEKFFKQISKDIKKELLRGALRLADYCIYSVKAIKSKTVKMFETQDDKETGVRNIANAKLPKNMVFLVSGLFLLAGVSRDATDPEANKAIDFGSIKQYPAVSLGEHSLKANRKQIIPEGNSNRVFITDNNHLENLGYWKLDNPRIINDEELIEMQIEMGTMYNLPSDTFLYVGLDGTGTTP